MRQEYDFKSTLKVDLVKKIYQDIIRKVIGELLEEKKKNAAPKIEIDISKLQNIRKLLETQTKLIVEDSEEITILKQSLQWIQSLSLIKCLQFRQMLQT